MYVWEVQQKKILRAVYGGIKPQGRILCLGRIQRMWWTTSFQCWRSFQVSTALGRPPRAVDCSHLVSKSENNELDLVYPFKKTLRKYCQSPNRTGGPTTLLLALPQLDWYLKPVSFSVSPLAERNVVTVSYIGGFYLSVALSQKRWQDNPSSWILCTPILPVKNLKAQTVMKSSTK